MRNMMIMTMLLLGLATALPSYAQEMHVKEVKGKEALIRDKTTGQEMRVQEGDEIWDGWKVISVTESMVTIEKETGPREKVIGQLPVDRVEKVKIKSN